MFKVHQLFSLLFGCNVTLLILSARMPRQPQTAIYMPLHNHFNLSVEMSAFDQLLGFLAGKGFVVDFTSRTFIIPPY